MGSLSFGSPSHNRISRYLLILGKVYLFCRPSTNPTGVGDSLSRFFFGFLTHFLHKVMGYDMVWPKVGVCFNIRFKRKGGFRIILCYRPWLYFRPGTRFSILKPRGRALSCSQSIGLYVDSPSTEGRPRSIEFYGLAENWKKPQIPYEKAGNFSEVLVRRRRVKSLYTGFY